MLNISKALGAGQVQQYYRTDFSNARDNYYTQSSTVRGEWQGHLAARWVLVGAVDEQQFARLADGKHPLTGEQLIQHVKPFEYIDARGEKKTTKEHRAGWDLTFSAPKSSSLTALVGGDERVLEAHRESVRIALEKMEPYVQARMGGKNPAETTGQWIVAKFEHDSARPVEGYSAPQLHTHVVLFNMTLASDGQVRSMQTQELFRTQRYATALYRSELAARLQELGYEIEVRKHAPEIKGYSQEHIEASSPRSHQIRGYLDALGFTGPRAAEIAAHQTRSAKEYLPPEEVQARHRQMAVEFGNQPDHVVAAAAQHKVAELDPERVQRAVEAALIYARANSQERTAVDDERAIMRDALQHSLGVARLPELQAEFERWVQAGALIEVERKPWEPARAYVTPEMLASERQILDAMLVGKDRCEVLADGAARQWAAARHPHLSVKQQEAVRDVLESRDQMTALEGKAGTGKTTSLAAIREAAEYSGYEVRGLAPTGRAAYKLADAGMTTETLQMHLTRGERRDDGQRRLYIVDESSMISTGQMQAFLGRLKENDRVLFVGDTRQHEAVEAGRPYAQMQEAGMRTARLDAIIRQQNPALLVAVENMAQGNVRATVAAMIEEGWIREISNREERVQRIAADYANRPGDGLLIDPSNRSRFEINASIHRAMQSAGRVQEAEYPVRVLIQRRDMATADRLYAQNYEEGDVLRYAKKSEAYGIKAGEYATVTAVDSATNSVTVKKQNGEGLSYDPSRLSGVTIYEEAELSFAVGDRVQLTAPYQAQRLANRELGTVEEIDNDGTLRLRMDGRDVPFNTRYPLHLDYGYAVTSHSSQCETADWVMIHVDVENAPSTLHNERMAYVSVSRAQHEVTIYTNDAESLEQVLSRNVSQMSALDQTPVEQSINAPALEDEIMPSNSLSPGIEMGIGH
jgi:conjugative relaxase-like TrwC/TraI family protein